MNAERIKLAENLYLDEYIPKDLYLRFLDKKDRLYGNFGILFRKLNKDLIRADQMLRDKFGPVKINDWWHGGSRSNCGLRIPGTSVGAELSDHFQGNASDKNFSDADSETVRNYIRKNFVTLGITIIEKNVTWVHSSVAWTRQPNVLIEVTP